MGKLYPNEKKDDYIYENYYIYGMQCLNCGVVTRFVVLKEEVKYNAFRGSKITFHAEDEFNYCEACGLITRQRLIALTPEQEEE